MESEIIKELRKEIAVAEKKLAVATDAQAIELKAKIAELNKNLDLELAK